jgi:hypothetical protein
VTASESFSGLVRGALWCLIIAACALQAYEISNRGIDPDELEHLHAAFCVWHGEVPYRDFFEHHAPALYYLLRPAFELYEFGDPRISVLWDARALMYGCSLATLWLTGRLARRWAGDRAGLLAMALLAWTTVFHSKGIELRPDVPATLLLLVAVSQFSFVTGGGSWRRFLSVGLLLGLAMLFTQKSIVPAAGIMVAACLARLVSRSPELESAATVLARVIVPIAAGVAIVWGLTSALFATAGAVNDFWSSTWYQLWIWPVRSNRWEHFRPTLAGDLTVWVAAIIEIGIVLRKWHSSETWQQQRGAAAVVALVCILSLGFVKATYPQFYLLWMPLLAALAATRIVAVCDRVTGRRIVFAVIAMGACLVVVQSILWRRAYFAGFGGALPHLAEAESANVLVLLALAAAMVAIAVTAARRQGTAAVLLVAGAGMGYGLLRDIDTVLWSNREQVAVIKAVNRQVPIDGRILDGFTGYGVLRPHEWYYWWINEYSLALVPGDELQTGLLSRLEEHPPAAVLFDRNIERLPENVLDWIRANYQPAEPAVLWLPRANEKANE